MNYYEAKKRWADLKYEATQRELTAEESKELREAFKIVEKGN